MIIINGCSQSAKQPNFVGWKDIVPGDAQTKSYFPILKDKKIALVANHTSMIGNIHLADSLLNAGVNLVKVFSPEHGFRGKDEGGVYIENNTDVKTGLPIVSLYGKHQKPTEEDMKGIDMVVFDIQDVGVRFYTYLSTMTYVMEACAENNIPLLILDRPNPNGFFLDGPILKKEYASFVGLHPIPIVHGMTPGEYALMVNGEGWLKDSIKCKLDVIKVKNYTHKMIVEIPIKPSPNLPDLNSILLYPSLCLFEGTVVSVGRGTNYPFEVIGHPDSPEIEFSFIPKSTPGASLNPPHKDQKCFGVNLNDYYLKHHGELGKLELGWIIDFYSRLQKNTTFFNNYFENLAGTDELRKQIENGISKWQIRQSWKKDLNEYKKIRAKYLLYPDFE